MPSLSWKPPSRPSRNVVPMPSGGVPNFGLLSSWCPGGVDGSAGEVPCPAPRAAPAEVAAWSAQLGLIIEPAGASWAGDAIHRVAAALRADEAQAPFRDR